MHERHSLTQNLFVVKENKPMKGISGEGESQKRKMLAKSLRHESLLNVAWELWNSKFQKKYGSQYEPTKTAYRFCEEKEETPVHLVTECFGNVSQKKMFFGPETCSSGEVTSF